MSPAELKQKALSLPYEPGVYIMMDAAGEVVYVGKAKMLKNRVSQYFQDSVSHSAKTVAMVSQVDHFDVIVADSEFEALVLECSLIKRHQPKYNILLKDDKGYPFIRLTLKEEYPRFSIASKWASDGARYFGPYGGRGATQRVIEVVSEVFRLPVCQRKFPRDIGKERPCLQYHMGRCAAPCRGNVPPEEYRTLIRQAVGVLEGKYLKVAGELTREMENAADSLLFEKAAALRDRQRAIVRLGQKQKVVAGSMADTDVVGHFADEAKACVAVLHFIDGALLDRDVRFVGQALSGDIAETVSEFVKQFYLPRRSFPKQVLLPCALEDGEVVAAWLSKLAGHTVELLTPQRGDKKHLVDMAANNAREEAVRLTTREERVSALLTALAEALALPAPPRRMEAYDISHTGGEDIVGAMTVFKDGAPYKKGYRQYRIKTKDTADDYHAMREVLTRRFKRYLAGDEGFDQAPDLLLIDGGSVHAATAERALCELGLSFPVYGMVKDDRHRTRALTASDGREVGLAHIPALFGLIGRIQEETHRFAITFHHERHAKKVAVSQLDGIPGVGPSRRAALLTAFKSMKAIKAATVEQLSAVVPENVARAVLAALTRKPEKPPKGPESP
ncbi:MAG: excinuclease ABC subunit UvrC [Oscillospiraceae bacterium]|jgi:excinuclease ABC subunit C|nr:excinuclease ABC subunit UvrC [Oscillospiraceae bacterium]